MTNAPSPVPTLRSSGAQLRRLTHEPVLVEFLLCLRAAVETVTRELSGAPDEATPFDCLIRRFWFAAG